MGNICEFDLVTFSGVFKGCLSPLSGDVSCRGEFQDSIEKAFETFKAEWLGNVQFIDSFAMFFPWRTLHCLV